MIGCNYSKNKVYGFNLIELIATLIIVALLAVFVMPKYIDLSTDAETNSTNYVAAALGAAAYTNYSAHQVNSGNGVTITNCKDASSALQDGLPTGFTIKSKAIALGEIVDCTLKGPDKTKATFYAQGT